MALAGVVALAAGHPSQEPATDQPKSVPTVYHYTAGTAGHVLKKGAVRAAGIEWTCRNKACTASGPWPVPSVRACQALAREVGRIVEFGHPRAQLAAPDLERCNQPLLPAGLVAKKVKQPAPVDLEDRPVPRAGALPVSPLSSEPRPGAVYAAGRTLGSGQAGEGEIGQFGASGAGRWDRTIGTKTITRRDFEADRPLGLHEGPPWLALGAVPTGLMVGSAVMPGRGDRGAQEGSQTPEDQTGFFISPWVLAGIVPAAVAIPLATEGDPKCVDVSVTETGITPSDATGDGGGTHVITWKTAPPRSQCSRWGIMVFCEPPGQPSMFPDELVITPEDAALVQFDPSTDTYSLGWTMPERFPPDCALRVVVGAGYEDMP